MQVETHILVFITLFLVFMFNCLIPYKYPFSIVKHILNSIVLSEFMACGLIYFTGAGFESNPDGTFPQIVPMIFFPMIGVAALSILQGAYGLFDE